MRRSSSSKNSLRPKLKPDKDGLLASKLSKRLTQRPITSCLRQRVCTRILCSRLRMPRSKWLQFKDRSRFLKHTTKSSKTQVTKPLPRMKMLSENLQPRKRSWSSLRRAKRSTLPSSRKILRLSNHASLSRLIKISCSQKICALEVLWTSRNGRP